MRLKLAIEPKPISTWGITLASRLEWAEWNKIRQECFKKAGYACEYCGSGQNLHCHEVWSYDDKKKIQRLVDFKCICELCHDVKHYGRSTQVKTKAYCKKLIKHWCEVNNKTEDDFKEHEAEVYRINRKRADIQYIVKVGRRILV